MSCHNTYILLFDGVCNLCNGMMQFVIKRDVRKIFRFAALQSAAGKALLKEFGLSTIDFQSIILIHDGKLYDKSTAVLLILKEMGGTWKLTYALVIIPRPIRDFIYHIIGNTRYSIFGKRDTCMIPTPELNDRFLA